METKEIILASLNESWGYLTRALDGLTQEEITWTPAPHSNSLAFILWHVTRAEDFWTPLPPKDCLRYPGQTTPERLAVAARGP